MTWRREVSPINRDVFFDLEFFLGSTHIEKNGATNGTTPPSGTDACDDGVCKFVPSKARKSSKRRASEDLGFGSAPTSLLFDRNGHTGTIALGDGSTGSGKHCNAAWAQTSEYCVAETGRRWTLTATCAVGATPDVAAPSDVRVCPRVCVPILVRFRGCILLVCLCLSMFVSVCLSGCVCFSPSSVGL